MHDLEKKLAGIKEKIEHFLFHPYLYKYIIPPTIDENKLLVLLSITDKLELSPYEKDIYIIAIMLMYIALDTHDNVSNTVKDEENMEVNQLTVLAGDYYSGLYYKLLAKVGDIKIIKTLSEGVKDINEHKVFIYHKNQDDLQSLMNSVRTVEFSLIGKFTSYFSTTNEDELTSDFLLYNRLLKEREIFEHTGSSIVISAIYRIIFPNNKGKNMADNQNVLLDFINEYLNKLRQSVILEMDRGTHINGFLEERIIEFTKHHYLREKTYVEEG